MLMLIPTMTGGPEGREEVEVSLPNYKDILQHEVDFRQGSQDFFYNVANRQITFIQIPQVLIVTTRRPPF